MTRSNPVKSAFDDTLAIEAQLDQLRARHPAILCAGYADISTDMMLVTSARVSIAQEEWDKMSARAVTVFNTNGAATAEVNEATQLCAIELDAGGCHVSLRSGQDQAYAICLRCSAAINIDALVKDVEPLFEAFGDW